MNCPRRRSGLSVRPAAAFSMLELLIVVTILLLLTAMYWGFETKGVRGQKQNSCLSNLQRLSVALDIFANDHTNAYPIAPGALSSEIPLELLVPKYTADLSGFICPASRDSALYPARPLSSQRISYAFYMGTTRSGVSLPLASDRQVNTASKLIGQPVFSPDGHAPGNNHTKDGGNVLFTDGHAEHSAAAASRALPLSPGVTLLNPKP